MHYGYADYTGRPSYRLPRVPYTKIKHVGTSELHTGQTCTNPGRQIAVTVAPTWNSEVAPRFVGKFVNP